MLYSNLSVNGKGHLTLAGIDTVVLAEKYGTPLYLIDENRVRENMRLYKNAMQREFGEGSRPLYASKALSLKQIYRIANEEGVGIDVVSSGELYTALSVGFPASDIFFHGNNKTDSDIEYAIDSGIGFFVADNLEEMTYINECAVKRGRVQPILLRLTPGIDPHTHAAVTTGKVDSKFGTPIETGDAERLILQVLKLPNVKLVGYHCHIGSQCFESTPFYRAAEIMVGFAALMQKKYGVVAEYINLGGGYGVRYTETQPSIDLESEITNVAKAVKRVCADNGIAQPKILMEPGRSIVADAGVTVYTVGSVKRIKDYKNYVSVDGGMTDNPRYALYGAEYTVLNASRAAEKADLVASVVGRCCESGDIIQENVSLKTPVRGEKLAVLVTGAYNYSMSSEYNRIPKPPVVMIRNGKDYLASKRQSLEDIARLDI